jgi:hypothetical protein
LGLYNMGWYVSMLHYDCSVKYSGVQKFVHPPFKKRYFVVTSEK